ncbi:NAD(P)-binding domain-containing protein [soil metagenome]
MASISFIGLGGMAQAIAARAIEGGNTVELIGRDAAKATTLAEALGGGATVGTFGAVPVGEIVVLAVPYAAVVQVVAEYGDALAGKVIVDISNTSKADATGLDVPEGSSAAQEIAAVAPASARVVKAFNTVFGHVLVKGGSFDVLFAGDDAASKTTVSAFIESLSLRPLDVGGLETARWLEGVGLLMISLARNGVGNFDFSLGITTSR